MSDGYYIYLDRRDVGKGDVSFFGWLDVSEEEYVYNEIPVTDREYIPIFSTSGNRVEFQDKGVAEKTVKLLIERYPELKDMLHVEVCEEEDDHD